MQNNWLYRNILEPLFFRWRVSVGEIESEIWTQQLSSLEHIMYDYNTEEYKTGRRSYSRDFVIYTYTNKYDGSVKIKKVYLN